MSQNSDLLTTAIEKKTSVSETPSFNFDEAVRSPSGSLELSQYLYDSGLQNIFNDYENNIASLDKSKQKSLEDAYYVRELSKKYLGEYASNTGIGDVSGNLLDIYGSYQQNKQAITENYDALKLNLTQEYRKEKANLFNQKLIEQFNISLADFQEGEQEIMFNASTGEFGSEYANGFEYLDAMKKNGSLTGESYRSAYGALYSTMVDRITTNLQNKNYEGQANAEAYINTFANLTPEDKSMLEGIVKQVDAETTTTDVLNNLNTGNYGEGVDGMDYLEQNRELIGEEAYQQYYSKIYADVYQEAFTGANFDPETMTVDEYVQQYQGKLSSSDIKELKETVQGYVEGYNQAKIDTTINDPNSETYVGDDFNFNAEFGDDVTRGSYMYKDASGIISASVTKSSEQEGTNGWYAEHSEINNAYKEEYGTNPQERAEITYTAERQKEDGSYETQDFTYVYLNGRWHRMVTQNPIQEVDMAQWKYTDTGGNKNDSVSGDGWKLTDEIDKKWWIFKDKDAQDTFSYRGVDYKETSNTVKDAELDKLFDRVHGKNTSNVVVYYKNNFYIRKNGVVHPMQKK